MLLPGHFLIGCALPLNIWPQFHKAMKHTVNFKHPWNQRDLFALINLGPRLLELLNNISYFSPLSKLQGPDSLGGVLF